MNKLVLGLITLLMWGTSSVHSDAPNLPNNFRIINSRGQVYVQSGNKSIAEVKKSRVERQDPQKRGKNDRQQWDVYYPTKVLSARIRRGNWREREVRILDPNGNTIATLAGKRYKFTPTYQLVSDKGDVIATLRLDFLDAKGWIRDASDTAELASVSQIAAGKGTRWRVTIHDPSLLKSLPLQPAAFLAAIVYQTNSGTMLVNPRGKRRGVRSNKWRQQQGWEQAKQKGSARMAENLAESSDQAYEEGLTKVSEDLSHHAEGLAGVTPTQADFDNAVKIVDEHLAPLEKTYEESSTSEETHPEPEAERLVVGYHEVEPMLEGHELTDGQKAALVEMLETSINHELNATEDTE